MEAVQVEELTSGASGRIIPVFQNLRRSFFSYDAINRALILIRSLFLWILLLILPRRHRSSSSSPPSSPRSSDSASTATVFIKKRKFALRRDEDDTLRRRALAEALRMIVDENDVESENESGIGNSRCLWKTSLFYGVRRNALFCRSWLPVSGELKYGPNFFNVYLNFLCIGVFARFLL